MVLWKVKECHQQLLLSLKIKRFWVLQLSISSKQEKKSEKIMILLLSEDATNFKTRNIALVFALQIELADGSRRQTG
jgi:hypothetical protein